MGAASTPVVGSHRRVPSVGPNVSQREIIASQESLMGPPVQRMWAGNKRQNQ